MTRSMPRGPKVIEAICPGCFKSFTKIGSMHRHIYEDRCRNPDRQFVQTIKAEHSARVSAAAARSAARSARAAARAAPSTSAPTRSGPPRQSAANKTPNAANTKPVRAGEGGGQQARATLVHCDCGLAFAGEDALQIHTMNDCPAVPQNLGFGNCNSSWLSLPCSTWTYGWPQG